MDIKQSVLNFTREEAGRVSVGTYSFDQEMAQRDIGYMIILHKYPFSMVEHIGFRYLWIESNFCFYVMARNTLLEDILKVTIKRNQI